MPNIMCIHKSILEVDLTSKLVKTSNTVVTLGSLTVTTLISGVGSGTTRPFNLTVTKSGVDAIQPDWSRL